MAELSASHYNDKQPSLMSTLSPSAASSSLTSISSASSSTSTPSSTAAIVPGMDTTTDQSPHTPTTAENQDDSHGGLSAGAKTRLEVGLGVGVPSVTATLATVFVWRKRKHTTLALIPDRRKEGYSGKPELDANAVLVELDATNRKRPVEMEG
ncbi:hypothetical protein BJX65DRAFT_154219 [Aspergillus insuetus]